MFIFCREDASHQEEEREDAAPKPEECTGKYVCNEYDGKAYLGIVEDANLAQVYVNLHPLIRLVKRCWTAFIGQDFFQF